MLGKLFDAALDRLDDARDIRKRRIRIGIEIQGRINYYEGLQTAVDGEKYQSPAGNWCEVKVHGLSQETRNYLATETDPKNPNRTAKRLIVEAGREGVGMMQLFIGDIVEARPENDSASGSSANGAFLIRGQTQVAQSGNIVSRSGQAMTLLSVLAAQVAADLGVSLIFQASDKYIANYSHTGSALKQVERLEEAGEVSAFIDNDTLIVKERDAPVQGRICILNQYSGLIGKPVSKGAGIVEVRFLLDSEAGIGGLLRLESISDESLNGDYVIRQLKYEANTHAAPFYFLATGERI